MKVKLEGYKIFCEVAKTQSFSLAAQNLFMSQPGVSQSVKHLEKQLGLQLFHRTTKGVMLSVEGKTLLEYAQAALGLLEAGEQKVLNLNSLACGEMSIGVGDTISRYLLLPYLEKFHKEYPEIKLKIINRTSRETVSLLRSGKVEIAFVNLPLDEAELEVKQTFAIQDTFVVGRGLHHFCERPLELKELAALPLILLERKANSRRYVEKFFLRSGVLLNPEIELGSHDLLLEFAKINLGASCVIREYSKVALQSGELLEIPQVHPIPSRNVGLVCLRGMSLSPAAAKLATQMSGGLATEL